MKISKLVLILSSHIFCGVAGFIGGVYALPILIAPPAPTAAALLAAAGTATYTAKFRRGLKDSDILHWGEGDVVVTPNSISLLGRLSPGPDYKLYLSPEFLETEVDFKRLKPKMVQVGDIKTFNNFTVQIPSGIIASEYNTIVIWCETFNEFITSARYK